MAQHLRQLTALRVEWTGVSFVPQCARTPPAARLPHRLVAIGIVVGNNNRLRGDAPSNMSFWRRRSSRLSVASLRGMVRAIGKEVLVPTQRKHVILRARYDSLDNAPRAMNAKMLGSNTRLQATGLSSSSAEPPQATPLSSTVSRTLECTCPDFHQSCQSARRSALRANRRGTSAAAVTTMKMTSKKAMKPNWRRRNV